MPKYSFIIPYRNRELERVQRCIQSVLSQSCQAFEVIFVDYGSRVPMQELVKNYLNSFNNITYIYLATQGWLWCKAHALNVGIQHAKGTYIIVTDIDIIYAPNFLTIIESKIKENYFCIYQCYYLPKNFINFHQLNFQSNSNDWLKSDDTGTGLLVAPQAALLEIGGFDTFFKIWGFEDMDIFSRLQQFGLQFLHISTENTPSFHQWHLQTQVPSGWNIFMKNYWKNKKTYSEVSKNITMLHNLVERPALKMYETKDYSEARQFSFYSPFQQACISFILLFQQLPPKSVIHIQQDFSAINPQSISFLGKFFQLINRIFTQLNISYRITELKTFDNSLLSFEMVRDFLFFFLVSCETQIEDYYWHSDDSSFCELVIIKQ
jgi:glycosyltransferase involved in cell wall biosynthesis